MTGTDQTVLNQQQRQKGNGDTHKTKANEIRPEVIQEAMLLLLIKVYSKKDEDFADIASLRSHKFSPEISCPSQTTSIDG